jgi:hypothetical protein
MKNSHFRAVIVGFFLIFLMIFSFVSPSQAGFKRIFTPYVGAPGKPLFYYAANKEPLSGSDSTLYSLYGVGFGLNNKISAFVQTMTSDRTDTTKFDRIGAGFKFQPFEKGFLPMDFGLRLIYDYANSDDLSTAVAANVIGSSEFGKAKLTINANFVKALDGINKDLGTRLDSAVQLKTPITQDTYIGVEYFATFGKWNDFNVSHNQEHMVGPMIETKIPWLEIPISAAAVFGLTSNSPDMTVRWDASYQF